MANISTDFSTWSATPASNQPDSADTASVQADLQALQAALKIIFPNIGAALTPTHTELNYVDGVTSNIQTQLDGKAPLAGAEVYKVGDLYITTLTANPSTIHGYGTWARYGEGRALVSLDTSNALMDTVGETFGSADSTLPAHTHTATIGQGTSTTYFETRYTGAFAHYAGSTYHGSSGNVTPINDALVTVDIPAPVIASAGVSATNKNYQPSIAVNIWVRTA